MNNEQATGWIDQQLGVLDGRYQLLRPIAKVTGGGYVLAAKHIFMHTECAIKLLDLGAPDKVKARMRREMEALTRAQGPGVVEFRDAGESEGRLYLVLELLEGRTLGGLLAAKGRLDVQQTLSLGVEIAAVLARCHERGVVHRDVKPANVFVTTDEHVRLLDFGIAKITQQQERQQAKLTQENTLLGTPEYMAPEALLSSPNVGAPADQYALGVMLYECLSGSVPFEGAYGEVLMKVSTSGTPPIRERRPDVPVAVEDVICRALRRDAAERFPDLAAMGNALRDARNTSAAAPIFEHRATRSAGRDAPTLADAPASMGRGGVTRRRHARAPYVTFARLRLDAPALHVDGRIEEISESGFQFVAGPSIATDTSVVVRFSLPVTGRMIEAPAIARWSREWRGLTAAGFEFSSLPDGALAEIRTYVELMCQER